MILRGVPKLTEWIKKLTPTWHLEWQSKFYGNIFVGILSVVKVLRLNLNVLELNYLHKRMQYLKRHNKIFVNYLWICQANSLETYSP